MLKPNCIFGIIPRVTYSHLQLHWSCNSSAAMLIMRVTVISFILLWKLQMEILMNLAKKPNEFLWKCEYWISLLKFAMGNIFFYSMNIGKKGIVLLCILRELEMNEEKEEEKHKYRYSLNSTVGTIKLYSFSETVKTWTIIKNLLTIYRNNASMFYVSICARFLLPENKKTEVLKLSVCLSGEILIIKRTRHTKFGKRLSVYFMHIKYISNISCHAHLPPKTIIYFFNVICKQLIIDTMPVFGK